MANEIKGGMIAKAQSEKAAAKRPPSPSELMKRVVNAEGMQELLKRTLKDGAQAFGASLIELYGSDSYLQGCNPGDVAKEALKAAGLRLPVSKQLGFCYIIPRRDHGVLKPQFQLGYKGYIQLVMRTGAYRYINAGPVYEGELKGQDKLSGAVDLSGEAASDKVIGYFAYLETVNGFKHCEYWPLSRVEAHARKFSDSYKKGAGVWRDNFDAMAEKTVLKALISKWGIMSIEMETALQQDAEILSAADAAATEGADSLLTVETTGQEVGPEKEPEAPELIDSGESVPWELTGENGEVIHG